MNKILSLFGVILSFGVKADFSSDSSGGETTIFVYDETISRDGDIVRFTEGIRNNVGTVTTKTYDDSYNCKTHRDSSSFLAPGTLGRSAADYACDFSKNINLGKPIIDSATYQAPTGDGTVWIKDNEYGMRTIATDTPCFNPDLAKIGYQYAMYSAIPISRLKKIQDAFSTDNQFAITVVGCWSPTNHNLYAIRKHDKKILTDENFHVDGTWTKVE